MLIVGYTTRSHLLLDLDETSYYDVVRLARIIMRNYPDVGNCLVVESSTPSIRTYLKYDDKGVPHERLAYQNFHLVFDSPVGYDRCVAIIDTLVELNILAPEYKQIRMFRGDMTLRVSQKILHHRIIPAPKPRKLLANLGNMSDFENIYQYVTLIKACRDITERYSSIRQNELNADKRSNND
jgi:hypothetical protein